ncbi:Ycf48-like protein precursor [bacterium BMS3Abin03]|nr:Ycf48-like protein precursor [bacterium BMS3Abin03]
MKTIILSIIFINSVYSQGTWSQLESPTDKFLKSLSFVDSLYGWVVGNSGVIINTTDGGNNWLFQQSNLDYDIEDVFFLNRNLGWAVAWKSDAPPFGTYILNTTNGGLTWESSAYRDENIFIQCVLFQDSLTGWMGGDPHALVKTTDGGITWKQAEIDTVNLAFFPVFSITFLDDSVGYAAGGIMDAAGVVWKTTNGGDKWFPIDPAYAPPDPIHKVHIFDSQNVIGVGGDPEYFGVGILTSTNGGLVWDYTELGIQGVAFDLDFRTGYEAWSPLGPARGFIYSLDSGSTWIHIPTPDSAAIYNLTFPDSLHGYAIGENGVILRYKPSIVNVVNTIVSTVPDNFMLYQNYPNPFNPATKIKFRIPLCPPLKKGESEAEVFVTLKVYDILGKEVAAPVNDELAAGEYEITFDAKSLPSGIYFYRLRAGELMQTRKMLIIR